MTTNNDATNADTSSSCAVNADQTFSFSFGPAASSPCSFALLSLDQTLETIVQIKREEKALESKKQQAFDRLAALVEAGEAEEQIVWNDYKISRRIRKTYTFPDYIEEQRRQFKAAEQLSLAMGEATVTITRFFDVRSI